MGGNNSGGRGPLCEPGDLGHCFDFALGKASGLEYPTQKFAWATKIAFCLFTTRDRISRPLLPSLPLCLLASVPTAWVLLYLSAHNCSNYLPKRPYLFSTNECRPVAYLFSTIVLRSCSAEETLLTPFRAPGAPFEWRRRR